MDFYSVDVETANADLASVCQIGIAHYDDSGLIEEWESNVNPDDYFSVINVAIHGIDANMVASAPLFPLVAPGIFNRLDGHVTVCHTSFDRLCLEQAFRLHNLTPPNAKWLDSAAVARRSWEQFAWGGYGLYKVCTFLGYKFKHHNALADAEAAGFIVLSAIKQTGLDIDAWPIRIKQPIDILHSSSNPYIQREGNPEGPLYGEVIVFTGALSIHRNEAADLAAKIGCKVEDGVNKQTTLLVVGDQDIKKLAGHEKSNKHQKAEKLISEGQQIRILRETDFKALVENKT